MRVAVHYLTLVLLAAFILRPTASRAQGETTSAIAGQVVDESGAALLGAQVSIINDETGLTRNVRTDGAGRFQFPQLTPGTYAVQVSAPGFQHSQNGAVTASLGRTQTVNFVLSIRTARQDITVTEVAPLISTENPNTATSLNAPALENLPNPGGD